MRYFIGVAWPYANGYLHLGHVAGSLLAPDIFARYHRMNGDEVLMVSGSDEHGTPITLRAETEGVEPQEIVDRYHAANSRALEDLGISFDLYFRTSHPNHARVVHEVFLRLLEAGHIYSGTTETFYCHECRRFLPDRYLRGTCPHCGDEDARGDQCDSCGRALSPDELISPVCRRCGAVPEMRESEHFFLRLSAFEERLRGYVGSMTHWKRNVRAFTLNWLDSGLRDRPITRDLDWGVGIPVAGYDEKRIYVWFEAVIGYLSASREWARRTGNGDAWRPFWTDPATRHYYFLGKDNIPFHTIIWPSMLMGLGDLDLPYDVPANEYLTLGGEQFSKSRRHAIWVTCFLETFGPDALRYYLSVNMPEKRDADFTWDDFLSKINNELVGTLGNFINRTLTFAHNNFGGVPPSGEPHEEDRRMLARTEEAYEATARAIEECRFKDGMREVMALAQEGNRYLMVREPWRLIRSDRDEAATVVHTACRVIRALSHLMAPYLPHAAERLHEMLGGEGSVHDRPWGEGLEDLPPGELPAPSILFEKIDIERAFGGAAGEDEPGAPERPPGKGTDDTGTREGTEMVDIDDLKRLDLRIGEILSVEDHPDADRLYVMRVDIGGEVRTVVAGLKPYYSPDEMVGKRVAIVANMKPANLRGVLSEGMLLAAEEGDVVSLLIADPDRPVGPGAGVR
ncbi:MAG TPA: methionine--tRNA ligase [Thermoplasmata archaeon]|nr:methionine--tRNA ligase [Thermoplasmata archaeon]